MNSQKIDMFMMMNSKYFAAHQLGTIKSRLSELSETKQEAVQMTQFKDPTIALILSIVAGSLGIDRFYIGDVGLGIAKLLTCGGLGIWQIVDWFLIMDATREKNIEAFNNATL